MISCKLINKVLLSLFFCTVLFQVPARGQAIVYDILLAGRDVGELKISPAVGGSSNESFRVEGAISTLFYDVVYKGENQFERGVLKTSMSSQEVNGKLKERTKTYQTNDSYQVIFADAKSSTRKNPPLPSLINHTVTSLYYHEPINFRQVYSERFARMCPIRKVATSSYEVVMPDGKKATYHYTQGRCHEVESEIIGIGLVFKLRPDSLRR
ncbi:DUF6134 family protein [Telluribacter sp.]|jgi:hypothetical protein|uniref:DUF6134 family protein n=1 Tax=Telluribacter sp. TaxID=1978767 RepID=UPI002E14D176|nr:DUF6134 family protein [Telluribacter sp.]